MIEIVPLWNQIQKRPDILMHASIYQWAAKIFQPGWVMDLGSEMGIGAALMESVNEEIEVLAYDINLVSLQASTECIEEKVIKRIQGDGAFLPLGSNTLTGICLVNTIHITEDPEKILSECCRVLKPGSHAVICIPTRQLPVRWHIKTLSENIHNLAVELFSDFFLPDHISNELTGHKWELGLDADLYVTVCIK
ncbi:MAG: class I SAM-dependent methyltransferase [Anaerolineales bacterium]|nr:class I SAM-dependent methyltransferase [Anaerolineales bacterium]